jgi:hypothetical protein
MAWSLFGGRLRCCLLGLGAAADGCPPGLAAGAELCHRARGRDRGGRGRAGCERVCSGRGRQPAAGALSVSSPLPLPPPPLPPAAAAAAWQFVRCPECASVHWCVCVQRHLRRRTTGHNSRQLPVRRRQRLAAAKAAAKADEADGAPPAKRQRVLNRRQRRQLPLLRAARERPLADTTASDSSSSSSSEPPKPFWLETHVWHAKRMQMSNRWGYVVPWHRNDLGVRAAHRAAATATVAHDRSYAPPLQLRATAASGSDQAGASAGQVLLRELLRRCGYAPDGNEDAEGICERPPRLEKHLLRWPATRADTSATTPAGAIIAPAEVLFLQSNPGADNQATAAPPADGNSLAWLWVPPEAAAEARHCLSSAAAALSDRLVVDGASTPLPFSCFEIAGSGATQALASIVQGGAAALTRDGTENGDMREGDIVAVRLSPERGFPAAEAASGSEPAVSSGTQERETSSNAKLPLIGSPDVLRALRGLPLTKVVPSNGTGKEISKGDGSDEGEGKGGSAAEGAAVALAIRRPGLFSSSMQRASWEVLVPQHGGMAFWQRLVVQCKARAIGKSSAVSILLAWLPLPACLIIEVHLISEPLTLCACFMV